MEPTTLMFRKTETVMVLLVTISSGFPSPSISLNATSCTPEPVEKSIFGARELEFIKPVDAVFLKTETELEFATAISKSPSPSMSPIA